MKPTLLTLTLAASVTLAGCNVEPQDGTGSDNRTGLNGLAVDGRVAGGKVWADMNNNNRIDDFEPYAYTDSDGYYSYNPLTNTNYCALPIISDEYQRYCLIYGSSLDSIVIRIKGGTDLSTGERLKGVMAMSSSISSSSVRSSIPLVLSPITTLLSGTDSDYARNEIREALGITSDADLRLDFSTASDDKAKRFLANSVAVQTMMDVLASGADNSETESNNQINLIEQMSQQVAMGARPAEFNQSHVQNLTTSLITNTQTVNRVTNRLADLNAEIKRIEVAADLTAVNAQLKASEVISQLIKRESDSNETESIQRVLNGGINTLSSALTGNLNTSSVEFDIASITNSLVDAGKNASGDLDSDQISSASSEAATEATLATGTQWGGSWFVLEATADDSDDLAAGSYIAIRLDGNAESTSGRIGTCVNVSAANPEDDAEVLENEYLGGRWSKLSEGAILLTFDYEGQEFEGQMKAKVQNEGEAQKFRFTTEIDGATESGDLVLNETRQASLSSVARPTSAEDCVSKVNASL